MQRSVVGERASSGGTPDFRRLFEAVTAPLLVVAPPNWTVVAANEARLRLTGTRLEDQIGRGLFDVFPDDPGDSRADGVRNLTASLERVLSTGRPDVMPIQRYAVRDTDGRFEERWWTPVNTPVLSENGQVAFIIHQVEEVTEAIRLRGEGEANDGLARGQQAVIGRLRAAEASLRASEEFNRRVLASTADCIKVLDLEGRLEFMSDGGMCVMEVDDLRAIVGLYWPDFWRGEEHRKAVNAVEEAKRGRVGRFQGFATTMKGSPRWWDVIVTPMVGRDGQPDKLLCVSRDVSAAHRAEVRALALVQLGSRFAELDDPSELAFAAAELLGRVLDVSRAGYGLIDKAAETITIERDWNAPGIKSLAGTLRFRDYGSYIEDLKQGRTVVFADAEKDPRTGETAEALKAISAQSVVNMPVTEQGEMVGLLYLNHATAREWSEDELAFVRDVAQRTHVAMERRRVQAELRTSEARLRAVLDAAPIGLVFAEAPSGRITGGNAQAERIFGHPVLPSPDIEHYRDWISFHPDGARVDANDYPLSRAIQGVEERPDLEVLYHRGDGRDAFVRLIAAPIRNAEGEITGGVVASVDIDREKRAEAKLRVLNETLERQVEARTAELDRVWRNSRDLLVVVGADGRFRAVNPAWTQILGHDPDEVVGRSYVDFVWPEDAQLTQGGLDDAAAARDLTSFENRYAHKDGSPRWISWHTSAEGDLVYAYGRDVTAEKHQAAALAETQEALRQSQKMEAVGQLTGGIAHDFNNMLAVVIGSLDLLARRIGIADARAKRYVDGAADAARRAAVLTQRLLAFSRQQPLQPKPIGANKLVAGISELIRGALGSDIRLETVLASGLWRTYADPNQLENVLLNLAVNARDAMPEGGRLTIETQNAYLDGRYVAGQIGFQPGQYVMLAVTDTGGGMAEEVVAKAFDPFFTTKGVGKGTGLGLSQVYGFVKQSGGHVKIYSEVGQGTTVKVYLPRLLRAEHEDADETTPTDLPLGEAQEVILVVEDEDAVRQLSVDALTELGYRVLEAENAATALRLLDAHPEIAMLFTDVVMPDVNGKRLAQEARQRRPDLRVLFTTGYTRNAVVHNGVLDPDVELIGKPFTIEELAARVREVLDAPLVAGPA